MSYVKVHTLRTPAAFREHLATLGIELPCDDALELAPGSPLAQPLDLFGQTASNRFAIQPMEGWDGEADGSPSELVTRRWLRFGESGAALIWGGEAVAVRHDGRANPNQLVIAEHTQQGIARLRQALVESHRAAVG